MSLTHLIAHDHEVQQRFDEVLPPFLRSVDLPLRVPSSERSRASLVGTAFDYALRFELQRLQPKARVNPWVALSVVGYLDALAADEKVRTPVREAAAWWRAGLDEAVRFHRRFLSRRRCTGAALRELARHALTLAALDPIYRGGVPVTLLRVPEDREVEEVAALLEIAPINDLVHPELWLNPTFGRFSHLLHADADLISGDRLIDVKTVSDTRLSRDTSRQLLGYFLFARAARCCDVRLPRIRRLSVYFARAAAFWSLETAAIEVSPRFRELERWFLKRIGCRGALKAEWLRGQRRWGGVARHAADSSARWSTPGLEPLDLEPRYEWVDLRTNVSCTHQHAEPEHAAKCAHTQLTRGSLSRPNHHRGWDRSWGRPFRAVTIAKIEDGAVTYLQHILRTADDAHEWSRMLPVVLFRNPAQFVPRRQLRDALAKARSRGAPTR